MLEVIKRMVLSDAQRDRLEACRRQAIKLLGDIDAGRKLNGRVVSPDFLMPTVEMRNLPLDDSCSEAHYYSQIQRACEAGLRAGSIPALYADYVIRAPKEIRDLLERPDERVA